jgi:benzylmalate synthase
MRTITLFDETLRDGEQQVGVFFSVEQKRELATRLAACGITDVDIMEGVTESEDVLIRELCADDVPVCPACLCSEAAIDRVLLLGAKRAIMFFSVSEGLLASKGLNQKQAFEKIVSCAQYASASGLEIDFAAEDASRTNQDFLIQLGRALRPHIRHYVLCDTVGCLQPNLAELLVREVLTKTGCSIGVHFHNDLGLAIENTIRGVLAGASMVSGTLTGIGERAGNANLAEVARRLSYEHDVEVEGLEHQAFFHLCKEVAIHGVPAVPLSEQALYTETGIHVHALMRDSGSYILFPGKQPIVWFGKYSGSSNFRYLFERELSDPQDEERYVRMRGTIKEKALREGRSFSSDEVIAMYRRGEL